jgi:ABC-type thiamine transport system ATPase subunit
MATPSVFERVLMYLLFQTGKTTLVKVLMGLYDHQGDLLINDQPIERFSPNQIHARTTCCFQDHSKYSLTLRENVGIGSVPKIQDDEAIRAAIFKGGATAIEAKVGLDGKLNRTGVPDASLGGGDADFPAEAATEGGPGDGEHRPPPPGVEGGRGPPPPGRGGFRGGSQSLLSAPNASMPRGPPPGPPPPEVMQMMMANDPGMLKLKERHALSGGQWQKLALSRAFMRADEADLVVFE